MVSVSAFRLCTRVDADADADAAYDRPTNRRIRIHPLHTHDAQDLPPYLAPHMGRPFTNRCRRDAGGGKNGARSVDVWECGYRASESVVGAFGDGVCFYL